MVPPAPYRPKDFALVKKDGVYHIFYIRRDVTLPNNTERDFGHAVSNDLFHWTQLAPVLTVRDSSWDNQHVWAPSILLADGVYSMFYTGVTNHPGVQNGLQRTGVATSTDLMTWNRMDDPVFACDSVPWTYCNPIDQYAGFRDAFVMPDPSNPGHYLMYYTATANSDSSAMVVGVATSDGDLTRWTDLKPLWSTYRTYTGAGIVESPHVFEHGGLWYLFYTTGSSQPIRILAGADPIADPGGWTYSTRVSDVLGYNTFSWIASEVLKDGLLDYLSFVNADRIEIYQMNWSGPINFSLAQPDLFHVVRLYWNTDSIVEGQNVSLVFEPVNWGGRSAAIEAFSVDSAGAVTPVPLAELGLPAAIPMTADTVRFTWTAVRPLSAGVAPLRLGIRLADRTAATPAPVVVLPDTAQAPPDTSFHVTGLQWLAAGVRVGAPAPLRITATAWTGRSVPIQAFAADAEGGAIAVPLDSLGLPPEIPLVADSTIFSWSARVWPASADTSAVMWLVFRLPDGSRATSPLRVGPDSIPAVPDTAFRVTSLAWKVARVRGGEVAPLCVTGLHAAGRSAPIEAFELDSLGALGAVPLDSLGLPGAIALAGDTTRYDWTTRRWGGGARAADTLRLVFRLAGDTLGTGALAIDPDSLAAPPDTVFRVTALAWKEAVVTRGQSARLCVNAWQGAGRTTPIAAYIVDGAGALQSVPPDSLGLPDTIALIDDITSLDWIARTWPDSGGLPESTRVVIRAVDFGIETAPLTVRPQRSTAPPAPVADPGGEFGPAIAEEGIKLRTLHGSASTRAPEFLVELGSPTAARLDVFDVMGRRVRNLADRILPAGASVLRWDGRAADGRPARAGVYFARLSTARRARITRAVLLP